MDRKISDKFQKFDITLGKKKPDVTAVFAGKQSKDVEFKIEEKLDSGDSIMMEEYYHDYMDKKLRE